MIGKALLRWLISLIAIIAVFIIILLSPIGLQLGMLIAKETLPGQLQYHHLEGRLTGPIEVESLRYDHNDTHIHLDHFALHWRPFNLLHGTLTINYIAANQIDIKLPKEQQQIEKPTLPFSIQIKRAEIQNFNYGNTSIQNIYLSSQAANNKTTLFANATLLTPLHMHTKLSATGTYQNYQLHLHLKNPHIDWELFGNGTLESVNLHTRNSRLLDGER